MTDVYFGSHQAATDIRVFEQLGRGTDMFLSWSKQFPEAEPLEHTVADWIRGSLSTVGSTREVSFETEDGWKIFGNLLMPAPREEKAPGVVLLHSGRSDRCGFHCTFRWLLLELRAPAVFARGVTM